MNVLKIIITSRKRQSFIDAVSLTVCNRPCPSADTVPFEIDARRYLSASLPNALKPSAADCVLMITAF